ncbi:AlbA family DNA-binding domain-containing protein [Streptosporangium sp. CA-115845]|uniref:AlbA family DNA-binding domain-containing protein n=1 Tax=Streptosporangium sp. CA-115845 TaxID=3240071 RepID=UPI003D90CAF1
MIEDFVSLQIPEGLTVEYKRGGDKAIDTIAAFANTYGGLLLYGVTEVGNQIPDEIIGVDRKAKDSLVNKMSNSFDPPYWSPEIIEVETKEVGKLVLVIRVSASEAPRPIVLDGAIPVRLDGRTIKAPRQMMRSLLVEGEVGSMNSSYLKPTHHPHHRPSVFKQQTTDPDLVIRTITHQPLWRGHPQGRFAPGTDTVMIEALANSLFTGKTVYLAAQEVEKPQVTEWQVDPTYVSSRSLKFWCTSRNPSGSSETPPGMRAECIIQIQGEGPFELEVCLDQYLWLPREKKLGIPTLEHMLMREIQALITTIFPKAMESATGVSQIPVPLVEVHVAARHDVIHDPEVEKACIERFLEVSSLGVQATHERHYGGSAMLLPELLQDEKWADAVHDALTTMVMDWGFPSPQFQWACS